MASSRGCEVQQLDFSESLELLAYLSRSRAPDALMLSKRVYSDLGFVSDVRDIRTPRFVRAWVSVLPSRLDDLSTNWAGHLTFLETRQRYADSVVSGKAGAVVGAVEVLILSTSRRDRNNTEASNSITTLY